MLADLTLRLRMKIVDENDSVNSCMNNERSLGLQAVAQDYVQIMIDATMTRPMRQPTLDDARVLRSVQYLS